MASKKTLAKRLGFPTEANERRLALIGIEHSGGTLTDEQTDELEAATKQVDAWMSDYYQPQIEEVRKIQQAERLL